MSTALNLSYLPSLSLFKTKIVIKKISKLTHLKLPHLSLLLKPSSTRSRTLAVTALGLTVILAPIAFLTLYQPKSTQAATLSLGSAGTGAYTIDVANRYRFRIFDKTQTGGTYVLLYDRAEDNSNPDQVATLGGPWITEENTTYRLAYDANRRTMIIENTPTRIKLRVEGCLALISGGACLTDGDERIIVSEEYTFTPEGFIVNMFHTLFDGVALDNSTTQDVVRGFIVSFNNPTTSHSETIYYGNGDAESSTATSANISNDDNYISAQGTGNYQSFILGPMISNGDKVFSNHTNGHLYYNQGATEQFGSYDHIPSSTPQSILGTGSYQYFFLFKPQSALDETAEREGIFNDMRNPDYMELITGTQLYESAASPGMYFTGTDTIDMNDGTSNTLDFVNGDNFTIELWAYRNLFATDHTLVAKKNDQLNSSAGYAVWIDDSTDDIRLVVSDGDSANLHTVDSTTAFTSQGWHHIAIAYDDSAATASKIYLNGQDDSATNTTSGTFSSIASLGNAVDFSIGSESDDGSPMDGFIDEVRVWSDVRTQAEIQANMFKPLTGSEANLVGYWRLDENTDTAVHDETTNNNDGTMTGVVWSTGKVPYHFNPTDGSYPLTLSYNTLPTGQAEFDLDAGSNFSTLLNGAASAAAASFTVDSSSSFPSSGVGYIWSDKYTYTTTSSTTFSGIPSSGASAIIGHADNTLVALMNRHMPVFKLQGWRDLLVPSTVTLEGTALTSGTNYNLSLKPLTTAYWAQDLTWYSSLESTTTEIGGTTTNDACTFSQARYGNGIYCNADNSDLTVSITEGTDYEKERGTVEFWYKPNYVHTDGAQHNIMSLRFDGSNTMLLRKNASDNLIFLIIQSATDVQYTINNADYSWSANQWVHLRVEWDDSEAVATQQRVYVNGVEPTHSDDAESDDLNSASLTAPTTLFIGNSSNGNTSESNGVIDEFRIYNSDTALTKLAEGGDTSDADEYLADTASDQTLSFVAADSSHRGEYLFMGADAPFTGLNLDLATKGVSNNAVISWDYWNGRNWADLGVVDQAGGESVFTQSGTAYWTAPGDWFPYSVNGSTDLFYVRAHLQTGSFSTSPIEDTILTDVLLFQYLSTLSSADQTFSFNPTTPTADTNKGDPPIAFWSMDEAYGTTTYDNSGNGNNLTISGATWTVTDAGMQPNQIYLNLDGSNDLLSSTSTLFNQDKNSFTLSAWIRHASTQSGTDMLIARYGDAGYKIYMDSSGYLCFGIDGDSTWSPADDACSGAAQGSYADSKWHHIEAVKSDTSSITLYIDGQQIDQDASLTANGSLQDPDATLYIGIDSNGSSNPWTGFVDNVYLYNYARTAAQVKMDFNGGPQRGVSF